MTNTLPKSLRWLAHFRPLITRMGIDYPQFTLIMATKMTLANRAPAGMMGQRKPSSHPRPLLWSFFGNLLVGVIVGLVMLLPLPLILVLTLFYSLLFFMFFLTMLTSYASLLLDPHDRPVYSVRGVSDRTLNAAKLTIVGLFLAVTMLALAVPGAVVLGLRFGPLVAIASVVAAIFLAVLSLTLALFMYMLVLHYFDGEKLKNILNVVQIGLAIGLYTAGQLPNLLGVDVISAVHLELSLTVEWWEFLAVPMWFAGLPLLAAGQVETLSLLFTGLSLGVPALAMGLYLHNAGRFEQLLEKLNQSSDRVIRASLWFRAARQLASRTHETAAYFTLGWRQLQSQRDYKLRVYPQLAYAVIIPLVFASSILRDTHLKLTGMLGYLGVALVIAIPVAIINLKFSAQPEAMQVFAYVPFAHRSLIRQSVVLALFMRLVVPFILLFSLAAVPFVGLRGLSEGLAAGAFTLLLTLGTGQLLLHGLPFTEEFVASRGAQNGLVGTVAIFGGMLLAMVFITTGVLLNSVWFDLGATAASAALSWLLIRHNRVQLA
ncbi:ABC transporter permease [Lacticaseibacillus jixianensis]|uniref:ABC transporter permease n=1 Tax=Lacticaseibacillus jixianensis TaxID=2486012 RepID=A0ABW4B7P5_9LACO|nr:ABC transporter permease [Lacticaseibacillus jixianensis]